MAQFKNNFLSGLSSSAVIETGFFINIIMLMIYHEGPFHYLFQSTLVRSSQYTLLHIIIVCFRLIQ